MVKSIGSKILQYSTTEVEQIESLQLDAHWTYEKAILRRGCHDEQIRYLMRHSCGGWTIPTRWPKCLSCGAEVSKGVISIILLEQLRRKVD
jgi:hypothetical protein